MRDPLDKERLITLLEEFGKRLDDQGRIYVTGGGTALLYEWREMTIDLDIKADPEPPRFYEVIATLKNELKVNIELASPEQFIPQLPGWEGRSKYIETYGKTDFYHYDPYSQALSKIERDHARDRLDVEHMILLKLIDLDRLADLFKNVKEDCIKYPNVDPDDLEEKLLALRRKHA